MDRAEDKKDVEDVIICVIDDDGDEIQVFSVRKKSWESREDGVDERC